MRLVRLLRIAAVALIAVAVALGVFAVSEFGMAAVALWGGVLAGTAGVVAVGALLAIRETVRSERRVAHRLEQRIAETRAKQSRHEYIQESALDRLEAQSRTVAATTAGLAWFRPREQPQSGPVTIPRVLFVTSNGGGMGHIARCAAVIRHSEQKMAGRILTLSTAAALVRKAGYAVEYFPSYDAMRVRPDQWHRRFARRLLEEISADPVDVIAFDGTYVYPPLTDVAEYAGLPLVWIRRGLWREGANLTQVESWRSYVSSVIVPADIAEPRSNAPEPFQDATWVEPVSLAPRALAPRSEALATLGLDPGQRYALVQLSGGNGDGSATEAAIRAIRQSGDIIPVVADSPLLPRTSKYRAELIAPRFPLVDVAAAWEYTITGAGYNSVHENLHTATRGFYVASSATVTDDQERRSAELRRLSLGIAVADTNDLTQALAQGLTGSQNNAGGIRVQNGAGALAEAIINAATGKRTGAAQLTQLEEQ